MVGKVSTIPAVGIYAREALVKGPGMDPTAGLCDDFGVFRVGSSANGP